MGNTVACQSQPKKPLRNRPQNNQEKHHKEKEKDVTQKNPIIVQIPPKNNKSQGATEIYEPVVQQQQTNICPSHKGEIIRAVCISANCPSQQTDVNQSTSRLLCCECLIEHSCPTKLRTQEYIIKLRSFLNKETLDVFQEIFDDSNQVRIDSERAIQSLQEQVKIRLAELLEKQLHDIIINYYIQQSELQKIHIDHKTMKGLLKLTEGKFAEVPNETIDLAITIINDIKIIERLSEQIETCRGKVAQFAQDFQNKLSQLVNQFIKSVKFLFDLFPTQMEYISDEEVIKGSAVQKQAQQLNGASAIGNKAGSKAVQQNKIQDSDKKSQATRNPQPQETPQNNSVQCDIHKQEIMAICVTLKCPTGKRKLCTDCLIEGSECTQRMKVNEFVAKIHRIISPEYIEELLIPWEDNSVLPNMRKVLIESGELVKLEFDRLINNDLKNLFVRFHLIEEATPKDLRTFLSKEYLKEFTSMISEGKVYGQTKSVELGTRFLINQGLVQKFLDAIVKTEQVVPQKVDKLLHKLTNITQIFQEKVQYLIDLFKSNTDPQIISKLYQNIFDEHYTLEESICKIGSDSKTLSEWTKHQEFSPSNNLSITDICYISDGTIAMGQFDGSINVFSLTKQKSFGKLKHGTVVTTLACHQVLGKPVLISTGFSQESGYSISVWDLNNKNPVFIVPNAHKDSIRKFKQMLVNAQMTSLFTKNGGDASTIANSSFISQISQPISNLNSQVSLAISSDIRSYEDQFVSCSDDGTVKLWRLDRDLKLVEEQHLRKQGQCVLDFTILNGCILIVACNDKSVNMSLPFNSLNPFQQIQDDCPVYAVSAVDIDQKFTSSIVQKSRLSSYVYQQKFVTGNERGIAKIYTWQNGKAVVQKTVHIHSDRINRFLLIQTGFIASVGSDGKLALTLLQQGKVLNVIQGHKNSISSITYIKELASIVTADQSGQIIVWK